MMCNHCYQTVTKAVESEPNVKRVRIHRDIVTVWYEDEIDIDKIIANIIERGYVTKKNMFLKMYTSASTEDGIKRFKNPILYNAGRLISYTALGWHYWCDRKYF